MGVANRVREAASAAEQVRMVEIPDVAVAALHMEEPPGDVAAAYVAQLPGYMDVRTAVRPVADADVVMVDMPILHRVQPDG